MLRHTPIVALLQVHKVYYSIRQVGTYELHIALREQSIPLAGSPFRLEVVAGPASAQGTEVHRGATALLGTVGDEEDRGCFLLLQSADKMRNACTVGGSEVECEAEIMRRVERAEDGSIITKKDHVEVKTKVVDKKDGTYSLCWRSLQSGVFSAHVTILGEAVLGSPFPIRFIPDRPVLAKTVCRGRGLKDIQAGQPAEVRLQLLDQFSNVSVYETLTFGFHLVMEEAANKEKNKWRNPDNPSDLFEGSWSNDEFRLVYKPERAGGFDLHLWCLSQDTQEAEDERRNARREEEEGGRKSRRAVEIAERVQRLALPGSPFRVRCRPNVADAAGSVIDGFYLTETVDERSKIREKSVAVAAGAIQQDDTIQPSGSTVGAGETILIRPKVADAFGNVVAAPPGGLKFTLQTSSGQEAEETRTVELESVALLRGDVTTYETRYTPKVLGHCSCSITLGGLPMRGSPISFDVLAGVPDTKMSRVVVPEPPLLAGTHYEVELITVDRFGNECTQGGAIITAKLQGANVPPGHDPNLEVVDNGNGRYIFKAWVKGPSDFKLYISIFKHAIDPMAVSDPKNVSEFPPMPLNFTTLKALRAKQDREARKAEKSVENKSTEKSERREGTEKRKEGKDDAVANQPRRGGSPDSGGSSLGTSLPQAGASLSDAAAASLGAATSLGAMSTERSASRSIGAQSSEGETVSAGNSLKAKGAQGGGRSAGGTPDQLRRGQRGRLSSGDAPDQLTKGTASATSKLRAAGAELMAEIYVSKQAVDSGGAVFGGTEAIAEAMADGLRKDVVKSKVNRRK